MTAADGPVQPVPPWWTDPTKNVESLVEAAMRRQDDLREMDSRHALYIAELRAAHARELRDIETARLDAIRAVDVGAVQRAAEVQATLQQALATQVVATADAFRVSLGAALEPIQKDIRDLRDAQSRGVGGKEQVTETRAGSSVSMQAVAIVVSAVLVAIALYAALHK